MLKKVLSVILTGVLAALASLCAYAEESSFSMPQLRECTKLYAYSSAQSAHFFGFHQNELITAQVIPSFLQYSVRVNGVICAVCHNGSQACALVNSSGNQYSLLSLNASDGSYSITPLTDDGTVVRSSFAADGREVFLIVRTSTLNQVRSFDYNGNLGDTYTFPMGAQELFCSGSNAYAVSGSGEIYRLSHGSVRYCAAMEPNTSFVNAGENCIYTEAREMIHLDSGNSVNCNSRFAVDADEIYTANSGVLFAAAGNVTALLDNNYQCVISSPNREPAPQGEREEYQEETAAFSGDVLIGLKAGTTVSAIKKQYPQILSIYDSQNNAVTSGKLRTGYFCEIKDYVCPIAVSGDLDGSGTVSTRDTKLLMKVLVGKESLEGVYFQAADLNRDSVIDTRDLALVNRKRKE